ncbi:hypothetical protein AMET1_0560 [Methanonatronarchaeum thermophilum]|uniref:Uncharacterized protein n=1 Tax=Methanonatronarchaeum thermophilum TaxID=1927129 RepID=A0A1Y3GBX0_9EURY|nr:hypothetical protein [Methanonatronarchaeum thermophilum]OUJ18909.1 hypothetical protein AMET1_0560 [Methanonatronarchaeum thermophilum]
MAPIMPALMAGLVLIGGYLRDPKHLALLFLVYWLVPFLGGAVVVSLDLGLLDVLVFQPMDYWISILVDLIFGLFGGFWDSLVPW